MGGGGPGGGGEPAEVLTGRHVPRAHADVPAGNYLFAVRREDNRRSAAAVPEDVAQADRTQAGDSARRQWVPVIVGARRLGPGWRRQQEKQAGGPKEACAGY